MNDPERNVLFFKANARFRPVWCGGNRSKGHRQHFSRKTIFTEGNINGGLYVLDPVRFLQRGYPQKFSFEKEYLEAHYDQGHFRIRDDGYFIDIGIPEDFQKAQEDLARKLPSLRELDKQWTILIDRDGVINHEKE